MLRQSNPQIHVLTKRQDMDAILPVWRELWDQAGPAELFLAPEWLLTWWDYYPRQKALAVVLVILNEEIVGIAPWYVERRFGYRRLRTLAHGFIDYEGILIRPGMERVVGTSLRNWLLSTRSCDEAAFDRLLQNIWIADPDPSVANAYSVARDPAPSSLVLDLSNGWQQIRDKLSRNFRSGTERRIRRLTDLGDLSLRLIHSRAELDTFFPDFLKWKCDRYDDRYRTDSDVYSNGGFWAAENVASYYHDVARKLLEEGCLAFSCLLLNQKTISAIFGIQKDRRFYYFSPAFLPLGTLSTGRIHLWFLLKELCECNIDKFDFLIGNEEYKRKWPVTEHPLKALRLQKTAYPHRIRRVFPAIIEKIEKTDSFRRIYKQLKSCIR